MPGGASQSEMAGCDECAVPCFAYACRDHTTTFAEPASPTGLPHSLVVSRDLVYRVLGPILDPGIDNQPLCGGENANSPHEVLRRPS
jgi:hypothetical protein